MQLKDRNVLKKLAAEYAVNHFVESDMIVGLGSGTTAVLAVRHLAKLLQEGQLKNIQGIACSAWIEAEANQLGIPITTLENHPVIDVTIDGADEVDPDLNLIKGGGGALLREKIVALNSRREVIIVDESKQVEQLGVNWSVPVEVIPFGWKACQKYIESMDAGIQLRHDSDGSIFVTDHGNYILDCHFGPLDSPAWLAEQIKQFTGIVEHGLFLDMTDDLIVATAAGEIQHFTT